MAQAMLSITPSLAFAREYGRAGSPDLPARNYEPTDTWQQVIDNVRRETVLPVPSSAIAIRCFLQNLTDHQAPSLDETIHTTITRLNKSAAQRDECHQATMSLCADIFVGPRLPSVVRLARRFQRAPVTMNTVVSTTPSGGKTLGPEFCYHRIQDQFVAALLDIHYDLQTADPNVPPLAPVGSPGVGKSTIARDFAIRTSHDKQEDVLILYSDGRFELFTSEKDLISGPVDGCAVYKLVRVLGDIVDRPDIASYLILDGFKHPFDVSLHKCNVFVTSGSFNHFENNGRTVLLPSWSIQDVIAFATEKPDVKLAMKEIRDLYSTFGGDIRSIFCLDKQPAIERLHAII